jgi:hypothetical protein
MSMGEMLHHRLERASSTRSAYAAELANAPFDSSRNPNRPSVDRLPPPLAKRLGGEIIRANLMLAS